MPALKNPRHELFAQALARGMPAVRAYTAAGYKYHTSSPARLRHRPDVDQRVAEILARSAKRAEVSIEGVMRELAQIGFANVLDYVIFGRDGKPFVELSTISREQGAGLAEMNIEYFKDGRGKDTHEVRRLQVKLKDKRNALVDLGKHLGMFKERGKDGTRVDVASVSDDDLTKAIMLKLAKAKRERSGG
jgi:phage terminase small subunit